MSNKVIQWNCNGIISHYCELKMLIRDTDPMCICLQETHLKPDQPYTLRGFDIVRKDAVPQVRAKSGVAIIMKSGVIFRKINITTSLQALAVQLIAPVQFTICNIYLPDGNWTENDIIDLILQLPTPYLLVGDLNAHNPLWGSDRIDQRGRKIENILDQFDAVLLNDGSPTFSNARSRTFSAIDLSVLSPNLVSRFQWNILDDLYGSDHFPIVIDTGTEKTVIYSLAKWDEKLADWTAFKSILEKDLDTITEISVESLTKYLLGAAEKSIPKTEPKVRKKTVPWWNTDVYNKIKTKKTLFNRYRKHKTPENLLAFKQARACARNAIRQAKENSWKLYVSSMTPEVPMTEVWRKVRAIAGTNAYKPLTCIKKEDGTLTQDLPEITEVLANQFASVSSNKNYDYEFLHTKVTMENILDFYTNERLPYNCDFTLNDLDRALSESKKTAPGYDSISYSMILNAPSVFKEKLLELYNILWNQGTYPDQWKQAIVIPILKENKDPLLPASYRPISLTCCIGKILERMVSKRLMWLLEVQELISPCQSGFRKGRSTLDNLVFLENEIKSSLNKREHATAVFFDLEKAFDMTWRYGILRKLHRWGFRGNLPSIISSFLSNRTFKVRLNGIYSNSHVLENGVPQGSTLSVSLFLIAVNDLAADIDARVKACIYVDDLCIITSAKTVGESSRYLQNTVDKIIFNAESSGFKISKEKTHLVHFCRLRKPHYQPLLFIKGIPMITKSETKFLGLIFDSKLTWKNHINNLILRCKKVLNLIKCLTHTKWGANYVTLMRLYKTLIRSKLDYGSIVYSTACNTTLSLLEPIQNASLRQALGAFYTSPSISLCAEAGVEPLKYRRKKLFLSYLISVITRPSHIAREAMLKHAASKQIELPEVPDLLHEDSPWKTDNEEQLRAYKNQLFDLKKSLHLDVDEEWKTTWSNSNSVLVQIKPDPLSPCFGVDLDRQKSVVLHRLRIGHTVLTHGYLLERGEAPHCNTCNVQITISHLLTECREYDVQRRRHGIMGQLQQLLSGKENFTSVINFLKEVDFYENL